MLKQSYRPGSPCIHAFEPRLLIWSVDDFWRDILLASSRGGWVSVALVLGELIRSGVRTAASIFVGELVHAKDAP